MADKHAKKGAALRKQSHDQKNQNRTGNGNNKPELDTTEAPLPNKVENKPPGKK
jgi:hypothetical protein